MNIEWAIACGLTLKYFRRPEKEERTVKRRSHGHIFQQCVVRFPLTQSLNIDILTHL